MPFITEARILGAAFVREHDFAVASPLITSLPSDSVALTTRRGTILAQWRQAILGWAGPSPMFRGATGAFGYIECLRVMNIGEHASRTRLSPCFAQYTLICFPSLPFNSAHSLPPFCIEQAAILSNPLRAPLVRRAFEVAVASSGRPFQTPVKRTTITTRAQRPAIARPTPDFFTSAYFGNT